MLAGRVFLIGSLQAFLKAKQDRHAVLDPARQRAPNILRRA
jgi:hypothetical protein